MKVIAMIPASIENAKRRIDPFFRRLFVAWLLGRNRLGPGSSLGKVIRRILCDKQIFHRYGFVMPCILSFVPPIPLLYPNTFKSQRVC